MAHIYFSMAGEGRGHAVRVRTLVEHLRREHEVTLFASDEAYEFLERAYGDPHVTDGMVRLVRIPGIRFHYTNDRLDLLRSIREGLSYGLVQLRPLVRALAQRMEVDAPSLVISDFEPAVPRAARRIGLPYTILDHQTVLRVCNFEGLPESLRWHAWNMSWAVWLYYPRAANVIASSFFQAPLKPGCEGVLQVGPMIRSEVADAETASTAATDGGFMLSYLRKYTPPRVLDVLEGLKRPIKVYGLGTQSPRGQLTFCAIDERRFVEDLAACNSVVCAAGNQLLGEALYLGKPVFAVPEEHHHEQLINAHFIRRMGVGDFQVLERVQAAEIAAFLERRTEWTAGLSRTAGQLNGTRDALSILRRLLNGRSASAAAVCPEVPAAVP